MSEKKKLFKRVSDEKRRKLRIPVLVNEAEKQEIELAAKNRNLAVGDWMRRAGQGRKADLRYDTQIVLVITQVVQAVKGVGREIQAIHASGNGDFEDLIQQMQDLIGEAKAALLRIDK